MLTVIQEQPTEIADKTLGIPGYFDLDVLVLSINTMPVQELLAGDLCLFFYPCTSALLHTYYSRSFLPNACLTSLNGSAASRFPILVLVPVSSFGHSTTS